MHLSYHILIGVGIDDLVSERTIRKIGSLRDIKYLLNRRLMESTSKQRPKLTKNSKERTLTATIRTSNHKVHTRFDLEAHLFNKSISIR
jgi:hypothetical protein